MTTWIFNMIKTFIFVLLGTISMSYAQEQKPAAPAVNPSVLPQTPLEATTVRPNKEKKATLSFEDELVSGSTQKPELFYLFQKKNFNYKRLIRLRENFLPEMRKTSEDIQRTRGGS